MIVSYGIAVPLILFVTLPLYKMKNIAGSDRLKVAVCIALPGMLIDAVVLVYFDNVFVNLPTHADRFFASWLMWAYALIVCTGFVKK